MFQVFIPWIRFILYCLTNKMIKFSPCFELASSVSGCSQGYQWKILIWYSLVLTDCSLIEQQKNSNSSTIF
ncbi:hypothetical protein Peur_072570 [Populus x canadensis]